MNKQTLYTELSIQIAVLEAKIDKVLDLLMKPEQVITIDQDIRFVDGKPGHGASFVGVIDYLGGSEDEQFLENYK